MDTTDFIDEINERINSRNNCVENRWEVLVKYKNLGMDKETMYNALDLLRAEFRSKDDEESEDIVMDYMDLVVGWCNPRWRVFS